MKYPFILFFRKDKYDYIDSVIKQNSDNLECTLHIINRKTQLNKIYKQIYPILIIFEHDKSEFNTILSEFCSIHDTTLSNRIIFMSEFPNINEFNEMVNEKFIHICSLDREITRPIFSIFTPAFNSFEKIMRAFNSLLNQKLTNWEWIIIDDSPNEDNFKYLKKNISHDSRVRLYRRFENNGYIGNVKNEAIGLCRGKYLLELDHDDEILPFVLEESAKLFEEKPDVGFIYMDFINIYEDGNNFWYSDLICKGYGAYYQQKYNNNWVNVYVTPNINNITLSHLVCCPNHPRIWRKDLMLKIGNYCEYLPICDDYEIILRTAINTKIAKIHKFGYIQYMNNENNNFSLIRNKEINRIGPKYISSLYYDRLNINEEMKKMNAYEDEIYIYKDHTQIWKRDINSYKHKYCNLIINNDYNMQYCIIGLDGLIKHIDEINELYKNVKNDFIILENKCSKNYLTKRLDNFGFDRMKCYSLIDESDENLINYFMLTYLSCESYKIFTSNINKIQFNTSIQNKHEIINNLNNNNLEKYLEIGVENGYTFEKVDVIYKIGLDPATNYDNKALIKTSSDIFFHKINESNYISDILGYPIDYFDIILIDGMHHFENVLNDFNNSIKKLSEKGFILINDCIPINYNEQLRIPIHHYYYNDILKYKEEWTGDVWKFVYYLLQNYQEKINFKYYNSNVLRGLMTIQIKEHFEINISSYDEINKYDYFEDFNSYLQILQNI